MGRHIAVLALTLVAALSGGCSTFVDMAGLPHPGFQADGGYVLTESESALDCRGLAVRIDSSLAEMKADSLKLETERRELPKTVANVLGRAFGGAEGGLESASRLRQNEARVRRLAAEQQRRNCADAAPGSVDARITDARSPDLASNILVAPTASPMPSPTLTSMPQM